MKVLLTGATGFVGRHLAQELASRGYEVRALVRRTSNLGPLEGLLLELAYGDVADPGSLEAAAQGCEAAIHLVAVIREKGRATFQQINQQGTANLVAACQKAGVKRLLYMSNIGAGPNPRLPFLYSKWQGEEAVKESGIPYTIFRSSLMFGQGDEFFTTLGKLVRRLPVVPIIGSGQARFQPIWVQDTARCLAQALEDPRAIGQTLYLGGPAHVTYEGIVDTIMARLGRRRWKLHIPVGLMRPGVWLMERFLPHPPVTSRQLDMLAVDNVAEPDCVERAFGFKPRALREGLDYLLEQALPRKPGANTLSP